MKLAHYNGHTSKGMGEEEWVGPHIPLQGYTVRPKHLPLCDLSTFPYGCFLKVSLPLLHSMGNTYTEQSRTVLGGSECKSYLCTPVLCGHRQISYWRLGSKAVLPCSESVYTETGLLGTKTTSQHSVVANFILIIIIPWLGPLGSQRCPKDQLYIIKYHVGDMWLRATGAEDVSPLLTPQDTSGWGFRLRLSQSSNDMKSGEQVGSAWYFLTNLTTVC